MDVKDEIIEMYVNAIEDATSWYLGYYCSSNEDKKKRLETDENLIECFMGLLNCLPEYYKNQYNNTYKINK